MKIHGRTPLTGGAKVSSHGDHRIGMMLGIAACICEQPIDILQPEAVSVSYPSFFEHIEKLAKKPEALCSGFFSPENHESRAFDHKTNVSRIACLNRINLLHTGVRATYLPEAAA